MRNVVAWGGIARCQREDFLYTYHTDLPEADFQLAYHAYEWPKKTAKPQHATENHHNDITGPKSFPPEGDEHGDDEEDWKEEDWDMDEDCTNKPEADKKVLKSQIRNATSLLKAQRRGSMAKLNKMEDSGQP